MYVLIVFGVLCVAAAVYVWDYFAEYKQVQSEIAKWGKIHGNASCDFFITPDEVADFCHFALFMSDRQVCELELAQAEDVMIVANHLYFIGPHIDCMMHYGRNFASTDNNVVFWLDFRLKRRHWAVWSIDGKVSVDSLHRFRSITNAIEICSCTFARAETFRNRLREKQ